MKSKEFGRPGGACVPHAPPRSANGIHLVFLLDVTLKQFYSVVLLMSTGEELFHQKMCGQKGKLNKDMNMSKHKRAKQNWD